MEYREEGEERIKLMHFLFKISLQSSKEYGPGHKLTKADLTEIDYNLMNKITRK